MDRSDHLDPGRRHLLHHLHLHVHPVVQRLAGKNFKRYIILKYLKNLLKTFELNKKLLALTKTQTELSFTWFLM